jgi:hypothetical protein
LFAEARRLVLDEYQIFPFIVNKTGRTKAEIKPKKILSLPGEL